MAADSFFRTFSFISHKLFTRFSLLSFSFNLHGIFPFKQLFCTDISSFICLNRIRSIYVVRCCSTQKVHPLSINEISTITKPPDGHESSPLNESDHTKYRSIVGQCLWASMITRVDLSHVVSLLSRFLHKPTQLHMRAAQRLLQYLNHHRTEVLV